MSDINLPRTPDGNDPADYGPETLDALNRQIDAAHRQERKIPSASEARAYLALYEDLKAKAIARGKDGISCEKTNAHYKRCRDVLAGVV